ncbi:minor capsid protein [Photobacterium sp. 1_MG-2023]|uniref:minor capsid protein n=1 Tax=Photobacterium sp. 1_MG-2023 TaxID=3062646 RepID=UPI0026E4728B|nr:minor capsid protein [Photobacterium sp. 1_MG-2023]MDO6706782.1 minor capsid protein [Photobacterium sp. 1_MG-2023]
MTLFDTVTRHQVHLEQFKSGEINQITAFLQQVADKLRKELAGADLTEYSRAKREKLLKHIQEQLAEIFDEYYDYLAGHLLEFAEIEAAHEVGSLNAVLKPAGIEVVLPAVEQVKAAIFQDPLAVKGIDGGKLLEPFIRDWQKKDIDMFVGAIRQGAFEGLTNQEIIRRLIGTKRNRYTDGLLDVSRRHADAIVRTSIQFVSGSARMSTWQANSDIVSGYRIIATLDSKTTPLCRTLDQQVYEIGKGPLPPFHVRCRTTTIAELADEFSWLSAGRTRSSMDGYTSGSATYYEWLKTQDKAFIDGVLGPVRGRLFRDGGMSATHFAKLNLDKSFRQITLDEFKRKVPSAWHQAFH